MSLLRAALGIITLPVDLAADILTLPAKAYYDQEFNVVRKGKSIMRNIDQATKP